MRAKINNINFQFIIIYFVNNPMIFQQTKTIMAVKPFDFAVFAL